MITFWKSLNPTRSSSYKVGPSSYVCWFIISSAYSSVTVYIYIINIYIYISPESTLVIVVNSIQQGSEKKKKTHHGRVAVRSLELLVIVPPLSTQLLHWRGIDPFLSARGKSRGKPKVSGVHDLQMVDVVF